MPLQPWFPLLYFSTRESRQVLVEEQGKGSKRIERGTSEEMRKVDSIQSQKSGNQVMIPILVNYPN